VTRVGHELASALTVLALPMALALSLPYGAIGFSAAERPRPPSATAAFVVLSAEAEEAAMRSAKSSWQVNAGGVRRMRVDLSVGELPTDRHRPLVGVCPVAVAAEPPPVAYALPPLVPSRAAPAPARIVDDGPARDERAFPREELLKID